MSYDLNIWPKPEMHWQQDGWGNRILRATFDAGTPVEKLEMTVDASFEIKPVNPFDFFVDEEFKPLPPKYDTRLLEELAPFLKKPRLGPATLKFAQEHPPEGYVVDYIVNVNRSVAKTIEYIIRAEPGIQTSEETLNIGSGSCRDSAVLLVDVLRHHGLAARFVSGYLIQLTDEGIIPDEAKGVSHDVVDLHAWAEVYIPGAGWIGLDGTSGLLTGEGHIPLAGTADPSLAGPVEGTASGAAKKLDVKMSVFRLGHEPRPRRPYTDEQWNRIRELGRNVDRQLVEAGLRLTMGGEPTWTSRKHGQEPEWNTEALGPTKWLQGIKLTRELLDRLAPGGLLLNRFGKQYPGESLPRWVMHLLWRPDGHPVWRDVQWLDFGSGGHAAVDDGRTRPGDRGALEAARFREALADQLGLGSKAAWHPGYEDPWHFIIEEENLPPHIDPLEFDLESSEERRRLARVLGRGLGSVVGHALPLGRISDRWATNRWTFKREQMFLIPGDSPMGLRLPLSRIDGEPMETWSQDPSTRTEPLEAPPWIQHHRRQSASHPSEVPDQKFLSHIFGDIEDRTGKFEHTRTALCVEPRGGVIHVFLPPVPSTEDFLLLVAAIENAAAESRVPVSLEGYPPPRDLRVRSCMVTPDPGVIEVNLPVTEGFDEYIQLMETVSDAANYAGLTTERYQLDGREAGSGGGHHLTLGGPSVNESPFLTRPRVVGNLLRFVQNHPSLSYLFTGLFVGPTSQAPRMDEARLDALYELEIALSHLESSEKTPEPWLVDRLLRNILVDVEGNTHRTEISIDKLYDPATASGRQGILEFRAFEMPPHERMAVAQMLLIRGLIARLEKRPYTRPLIRWGSQLHDRFMLPHYLWADFKDVIRELRDGGFDYDPELYRPFLDFRCPLIGQYEIEDIQLELRSALEPWPVLGEEGAVTGTVRYVDSSVERLEVKVRGLTHERHALTVNGLQVPLKPTGEATEGVAGVRFKAWQPPHGLQPTLPVNHPLRFDVVDTWARRSLGAATYHVWHPLGRGYDEFPLTAFEAAARRAQRFTIEGHAPYPASADSIERHPEQPFSLDLRRFNFEEP